ncbi:MAG: multiprotein bridging factor aMBF1 [Nanobdellota archaeon]
MGNCDMCGNKDVKTTRAKVEGVEMSLCPACLRFGTPLKDHTSTLTQNKTRQRNRNKFRSDPDENKQLIGTFPSIIKRAREQKGLTHEKLAKQINEKESLIHKFESNSMRPRFSVARKLERLLNIQLIEEAEAKPEDMELPSSTKDEGLTMGDILKNAMKKKR